MDSILDNQEVTADILNSISVDLGGDNVARVRDRDLAGDPLEKHRRTAEKESEAEQKHQQRKAEPRAPAIFGRACGVDEILSGPKDTVHGRHLPCIVCSTACPTWQKPPS